MKIYGSNLNLFKDIIIPTAKKIFNFKHIRLERQPKADELVISLEKENNPGINSKTFQRLLTPEFTPKNNTDPSGLKITTLIDKKTNKPVEAFVTKVIEDDPNMEKYYIMLPDANGEISVQNNNYKIIGDTYFYIDKKHKMISPKFESDTINEESYEKIFSFMKAKENNEFGGIGLRLHQLRVERMLQNGLGNVCIVAKGNSFPFHYAMGYRLAPVQRPIEDLVEILQKFSHINKLHPKENSKYLFVEYQDGKPVINWSTTLEHFLDDYYKNSANQILDFSPNMYLNETSLKQWFEMIKKQPILY